MQFLTSAQIPDQSMKAFVLQYKTKAAKCEFCPTDRQQLIRDILIMGILHTKLQRELLKDKNLTLESAILQCKIWEKEHHNSKIIITTQVQESTSLPVSIHQVVQEKTLQNKQFKEKLSKKKEIVIDVVRSMNQDPVQLMENAVHIVIIILQTCVVPCENKKSG